MTSWIAWTIERRRQVIILLATLAAIFVPGLLRLTTDNSAGAFAIEGAEVTNSYDSFRSTFGSDRVVRLVARGEALWTPLGLDWWSDLERRIAGVPGVIAVIGPISFRDRLGLAPVSSDAVAVLHTQLRTSPLARSFGWTTPDTNFISCLLVLDETGDPEVDLAPLVALEGVVNNLPAGVSTEFVGLPILSRELDRSAREIGLFHLPVLILISMATLAWCLRRVLLVAMALLLVAGSLLTVHGSMGWFGHELNLMTSIAAPLLFAIGLATSIHVLLEVIRCRGARASTPSESIMSAYRNKGWAIFWSGATTIIGFGSLVSSRVPPVRELGFWVSIGLVTITVSAFLVLPALLACIPIKTSSTSLAFERNARRWGRRLGTVVTNSPHRVVALAGASGLLAAVGLSFLKVETNALNYIPENHPVRSSIAALEVDSIATASVELVFERADLPAADADMVRWLAELEDALDGVPGVVSVSSLHTLLAELDTAFFGLVTLPVLRASPLGVEALDSFLSEPSETVGSQVRVSLGTTILDVAGFDQLSARISELVDQKPVAMTGRLPALLETQRYLLSTMFRSGGLTVSLVSLLMIAMLGRLRLAVLAMVPNLAALLIVFGVMGWLGSPLDIATVMVAATVLGLAVDYTIHSLAHFRQLESAVGCREALIGSLEITMPAYLLSGTVLLLGFAACSFSSFAPVAHFGLFSAVAIAAALIGVILVLPALVLLTHRQAQATSR